MILYFYVVLIIETFLIVPLIKYDDTIILISHVYRDSLDFNIKWLFKGNGILFYFHFILT